MSIPTGWVAVIPGGPWGIGGEPFFANVPAGAEYTDQFGNRCVALPDGSLVVEGLGAGVNAGKPDGEWWPYTPLLDAGPTNAAPWVTDNSQGRVENADGTPVVVRFAPIGPTKSPNPFSSGTPVVTPPSVVTVLVTKDPTIAGHTITVIKDGEKIAEEVWATLDHAVLNLVRLIRKHF